MAATDPDTSPHPSGTDGLDPALSAPELVERLEEEIGRAERHGTHLSCLLLVLDELDEVAREHGVDLPPQTLAYLAGALIRELRRFDRIGRPAEGELLIVLPGADGPRGEMVARRVLERVGAIKVEADGMRRPLNVTVGLAAWQGQMGPADLLARTRAAVLRPGLEEPGTHGGARGRAQTDPGGREGGHPEPPPWIGDPAPS
jgi:GGDEF domain-containing protein